MPCYIYIWNKLLSTPACLFVIDGTEIRSNEGTTQRHTVCNDNLYPRYDSTYDDVI